MYLCNVNIKFLYTNICLYFCYDLTFISEPLAKRVLSAFDVKALVAVFSATKTKACPFLLPGHSRSEQHEWPSVV